MKNVLNRGIYRHLTFHIDDERQYRSVVERDEQVSFGASRSLHGTAMLRAD